MTREGEPWFVGTDVCKSIEIANAPHALSRLDNDERATIALNDSGKRDR
jgi:prophage antirepressor-like protein